MIQQVLYIYVELEDLLRRAAKSKRVERRKSRPVDHLAASLRTRNGVAAAECTVPIRN